MAVVAWLSLLRGDFSVFKSSPKLHCVCAISLWCALPPPPPSWNVSFAYTLHYAELRRASETPVIETDLVDLNKSHNDWDEGVRKATLEAAARPPHLNRNTSADDDGADSFPLPSPAASPMTSPNANAAAAYSSGSKLNMTDYSNEVDADAFGSDMQFGFGTMDISTMGNSNTSVAGGEVMDEGYLQLGDVSAISAAGGEANDEDDDYGAAAKATEADDSLWDDAVAPPPTRAATARRTNRRRAPVPQLSSSSSPGPSRLGMAQPVASAAAAALMAEARVGGAAGSPLSRHGAHNASIYAGFGDDVSGGGGSGGGGGEATEAIAVRQSLERKLSNGQISKSEYDQILKVSTAGSKFNRSTPHNASVYAGFGDDAGPGGMSTPKRGGISRAGRDGSVYHGFQDASTPSVGSESTPLGFGKIGTLDTPSPGTGAVSRANSAMSDYSGFGDVDVDVDGDGDGELDLDGMLGGGMRQELSFASPSPGNQSDMLNIDEDEAGEEQAIRRANSASVVAEAAVKEAEEAEREHAEAEQLIKEKEEAAANIAAQLAALAEEEATEAAAAEAAVNAHAEAERVTKENEEAERVIKEKEEAERVVKEKEEAERVVKEKEEAAAQIAAQLAALAAEEAEAEVAEKARIVEEARVKKEDEAAKEARNEAARIEKEEDEAAVAAAAAVAVAEAEVAAAEEAAAAAVVEAAAAAEEAAVAAAEAAAAIKRNSRVVCTCKRFKCVCEATAAGSDAAANDASTANSAAPLPAAVVLEAIRVNDAAAPNSAASVGLNATVTGRKSIVQLEMEATLAKEQQVDEDRKLAALEEAASPQNAAATLSVPPAADRTTAVLEPKEEGKSAFQREMEENASREQELAERAHALKAAKTEAEAPTLTKVVATAPDPEAAVNVKSAFEREIEEIAAREKELMEARSARASSSSSSKELPQPRTASNTLPVPRVMVGAPSAAVADDGTVGVAKDAYVSPAPSPSPSTKKKKWAPVKTAAEKMAEDMAKLAADNASAAPPTSTVPELEPEPEFEPQLNATAAAAAVVQPAKVPSPKPVKKWGKVQTAAEKMAEDMAKLAAEKASTLAASASVPTPQQPAFDVPDVADVDPAPVAAAVAEAASPASKVAIQVKKSTPNSSTSTGALNPYAAKAAAAKARCASEAASKPSGDAVEAEDVVPALPNRRLSISDRLFPALSFGVDVDGNEADGGDGDELEELDPRAIEAAAWTDKEIRKLISEIKSRGYTDDDGKHAITFGQLFEETDQIFDALSGICKTAKKYKVLAFDAEQLWQGQNDSTVITLLKETHDGVEIKRRKKSSLVNIPASRKGGSGFGGSSLATQNAKCHVCEKTVYQVEFVGASDKAFHKNCFRCKTCNSKLSQNDYAVGHDRNFRCGAHHREFEMSGL